LSVAIIDSLPFGGTCALRGCDPKKVLVETAKIIDSNQRHENKGIIGSQGLGLGSVLSGLLLRLSQSLENTYINDAKQDFICILKISRTNYVDIR
jgi:hypothetical protein